MKNKFLSVSIGVAMMLLAGGFFIRSFYSAKASPTTGMPLQQQTANTGKYQACIASGGAMLYYALILNTETGESRCFTFYSGAWSKTSGSAGQLPANPFEY